jgi:hypothetical protein
MHLHTFLSNGKGTGNVTENKRVAGRGKELEGEGKGGTGRKRKGSKRGENRDAEKVERVLGWEWVEGMERG